MAELTRPAAAHAAGRHRAADQAKAIVGRAGVAVWLALTYAYITLIRRPWWEKAFLALAAVPIAIVSNATRIVVTGLLYQITESEATRQFAHDYAGFGMILLAAGLFWLVLWYLSKLIREDEAMDMASLVRKARI